LALEFLPAAFEQAALVDPVKAKKYVPGVVIAKVVHILLARTQVTVVLYVAVAKTLSKENSLMEATTGKVGSYQTQVKKKDYVAIVVPSDFLTASTWIASDSAPRYPNCSKDIQVTYIYPFSAYEVH